MTGANAAATAVHLLHSRDDSNDRSASRNGEPSWDWTRLRFRDAKLESAYINKVFSDSTVVFSVVAFVIAFALCCLVGMDFHAALGSTPPWEMISVHGDYTRHR